MHWLLVAVGLLAVSGCCSGTTHWSSPNQPIDTIVLNNPLFVSGTDHELIWETVCDVVDDYFVIARSEPVRQVGNMLTEGRIETAPKAGATYLEPWDKDSASSYERLESTLQSIRRFAVIRVIPTQGGYWIDTQVYKELEDVARPAFGSVGPSTFHLDSTFTRVLPVVGEQETHSGWIPQGRDGALEQRLLGHFQYRIAGYGAPRRVM